MAARLCRERRDELRAKKLDAVTDRLAKYNYSEDVFFVRGIRSHADLIDEARQQRNCVACYADSIISGRSKIYVMREKAHPEKSLITIEIDGKGNIRQALLAGNKPIRNRAQSEFLERWKSFVQQKMLEEKIA